MSKNEKEMPENIEDSVSEAMALLEKLGYRETRKRECRAIWNAFLDFKRKHDVRFLTPEVFEKFVSEYTDRKNPERRALRENPKEVRTIMLLLTEFHMHGCWKLHHDMASRISLPQIYMKAYENYMRYCEEWKHLRKATLDHIGRHVLNFLSYLEVKNIQSWEDLRPEALSHYIISQKHLSPISIKGVAGIVRGFLDYLYMERITNDRLSLHVPEIRVPKNQHLPSVWSAEEVEKILGAVDRNSPVGKRDYAILLIASRLGLRVGDIRTLRLEDIRWDECRIVKEQSKTGKTLSLPLTQEVGESIIDYLRNARPQTHYREVFLKLRAPIQPFCDSCSFFSIIETHRKRAGVLHKGGPRGMHSLRHTVACMLLQADTPFETIADILGHTRLENTLGYARVDISGLRSAALDPEEVCHA